MRRLLPAAVLAMSVLTACGGSDVPQAAEPAPAVAGPSQPARPKCAEVFAPGRVIQYGVAQASLGCLDPDGGVQIVGSRRCADGRYLYNVDAATGAPKGWGVEGQPYHASNNLDTDAEFSKAYDVCNG